MAPLLGFAVAQQALRCRPHHGENEVAGVPRIEWAEFAGLYPEPAQLRDLIAQSAVGGTDPVLGSTPEPGRLAHQQRAQVIVRGNEFQAADDQFGEPLAVGGRLREAADELVHHPRDSILDEAGEQILLVGKVLVERRPADPDVAGHVAERRLGVALNPEQCRCCLDDFAASQRLVLCYRIGANTWHHPQWYPAGAGSDRAPFAIPLRVRLMRHEATD